MRRENETTYYVAVRQAGYSNEWRKEGQEFFDIHSISEESEENARACAESYSRLVSTPDFELNAVHPIVRVAKVRIIELEPSNA